MTSSANQEVPDQLFKPSTFYTLSGSAFGVWVLCLILGSIFPGLTTIGFRVVALSISQIIAIVIVIRDKRNRKRFDYWVLTIFNAALIFVNASGYNAVTYNLSFEMNRKAEDSAINNKAGLVDIINQKDWWPDKKMVSEKDSLVKLSDSLKQINLRLFNQFAWLKDWIKSNVKDKKTRDTLSELFKYFGKVDYYYEDRLITNASLRYRIDSLLLTISIMKANEDPYIEIGAEKYRTSAWIDTLYFRNLLNQNQISSLTQQLNNCVQSKQRYKEIIDSAIYSSRRKLDSLRKSKGL